MSILRTCLEVVYYVYKEKGYIALACSKKANRRIDLGKEKA
jgi:hypothetical protein